MVWQEKHGQCLDNIRDGISTNPNAGRGVFANRFIPKGGQIEYFILTALVYIEHERLEPELEATGSSDSDKPKSRPERSRM